MLPIATLILYYQEGPAVVDQLSAPHVLLAFVMLFMTLYFGLVIPEDHGANLRHWRRHIFGFLPVLAMLAAVFHQPVHSRGVLIVSRFTIRNVGVGVLSALMFAAIATQGVGTR